MRRASRFCPAMTDLSRPHAEERCADLGFTRDRHLKRKSATADLRVLRDAALCGAPQDEGGRRQFTRSFPQEVLHQRQHAKNRLMMDLDLKTAAQDFQRAIVERENNMPQAVEETGEMLRVLAICAF